MYLLIGLVADVPWSVHQYAKDVGLESLCNAYARVFRATPQLHAVHITGIHTKLFYEFEFCLLAITFIFFRVANTVP